MDPLFLLNVAMRWLHIAAAVAGLGGAMMMRLVVVPALDRTPEGAAVLDTMRPGFKRLMHSAIGVLLLTGIYNYVVVAVPRVRESGLAGYHGVMGVKILLSLALFGIALGLLAPIPAMHARRKAWLTANVVLGLCILLLGAYLRRLWSA